MNDSLLNAIKIMALVVVLGIVLFLICIGGGRLTILFNLLITPLIWIFTFPLIGPVIIAIAGLATYAILVKHPSPKWKVNEKHIFIILLSIISVGFLASSGHAGIMFLLICLVGVSYPIIQIVRMETKRTPTIMKLLK